MKYKIYPIFTLDNGDKFLVPHIFESAEDHLDPETVATCASDIGVPVPQDRLRVEFHLQPDGDYRADLDHVQAELFAEYAQGTILIISGPSFTMFKERENDRN